MAVTRSSTGAKPRSEPQHSSRVKKTTHRKNAKTTTATAKGKKGKGAKVEEKLEEAVVNGDEGPKWRAEPEVHSFDGLLFDFDGQRASGT